MVKKKYKVIGIMSGTSLDGLDIAYCEFEKDKKWRYKIIHAETKKYSREWKQKLNDAVKTKKSRLKKSDKEYGNFIGKEVFKFIIRKKITPDFIASHGHTVFHQPEKKLTLQIGDGAAISSVCHLPVVYDFRSGDVAIGGQGAPLVPIADKLLFSGYDFCLNLGGIANISYDNQNGERIAYDICPVNIVLNVLANKFGKEFDKDGILASKGKINFELFDTLNSLSFYKQNPPKSLGREWIEQYFFPVLNSFSIPIHDKLRTVCEHIAIRISSVVNLSFVSSRYSSGQVRNSSLLITGGGAYNKFLKERIFTLVKCKIILPDDRTIRFKEAMAFAFLGVLKTRGEINILKSVTGAKKDSSGGIICRG